MWHKPICTTRAVKLISRLELEAYDPRGLLIPVSHTMRSLTVRDVQDADDWIVELLALPSPDSASEEEPSTENGEEPRTSLSPRFPNLRHLSIHNGSLLDFPSLPLSSLTHLDLSHNLLEHLPPSLSSLHSLQSLNLSDNVIRSLRSAHTVLGNVTSLNLARNRIDCVVGLERVLGLERIDLRGNEIEQWDEVGRLAELPHVAEIWYAGNPFDLPPRLGGVNGQSPEEVRTELGVIFAQNGRGQVVFDQRPWSWNETRKIESLLSSRGVHRQHTSHSRSSTATRTQRDTPVHADVKAHAQSAPVNPSPTPSRLPAYPSTKPTEHNGTSSPAPSTLSKPAQGKKRRPRRVINLDEAETSVAPSQEPFGGSLRVPLRPSGEDDRSDQDESAGDTPGHSANAVKVKKKERRKVSASMFEPATQSGT